MLGRFQPRDSSAQSRHATAHGDVISCITTSGTRRRSRAVFDSTLCMLSTATKRDRRAVLNHNCLYSSSPPTAAFQLALERHSLCHHCFLRLPEYHYTRDSSAMAQVIASAATSAASQIVAGRQSATAASSGWAQPQRIVMNVRQPFGKQQRRSRVAAVRPQAFCGPQFGMGMGPMGGRANFNMSPAEIHNMVQVGAVLTPCPCLQ